MDLFPVRGFKCIWRFWLQFLFRNRVLQLYAWEANLFGFWLMFFRIIISEERKMEKIYWWPCPVILKSQNKLGRDFALQLLDMWGMKTAYTLFDAPTIPCWLLQIPCWLWLLLIPCWLLLSTFQNYREKDNWSNVDWTFHGAYLHLIKKPIFLTSKKCNSENDNSFCGYDTAGWEEDLLIPTKEIK